MPDAAKIKRRQRATLTYGYIRDLLHKETGLPRASFPMDMVVFKQSLLQLRRMNQDLKGTLWKQNQPTPP
jgi:hypothetical protein